MPATQKQNWGALGAGAEGQSAECVFVSLLRSSREESRGATGEAIGRQSSGDCTDPSSTIEVVSVGWSGEKCLFIILRLVRQFELGPLLPCC